MVGRETGHLYREVVEHADRQTLERVAEDNTAPGCMAYTDDWGSYRHLPELGRGHASVCHTPGKREWARGDDGDGVREVHDNTLEGTWAGLRNFLRPFRGVSKHRLQQYVSMFQWAQNLKVATDDFLRTLLGVKPSTG